MRLITLVIVVLTLAGCRQRPATDGSKTYVVELEAEKNMLSRPHVIHATQKQTVTKEPIYEWVPDKSPIKVGDRVITWDDFRMTKILIVSQIQDGICKVEWMVKSEEIPGAYETRSAFISLAGLTKPPIQRKIERKDQK